MTTSKRFRILPALTLLAAAAPTIADSSPALAQQTPTMKDARTQKILSNQYRCGVYYYDTRSSKTPLDVVEREANRMADMGFNYIYAAVSVMPGNDYAQLEKLLEVAAQRGMAVRIQAGGQAYLRSALEKDRAWKPGYSATKLADAAIPFIEKYRHHPNVIDFLVMEEPAPQALPFLREYYAEIFRRMPDAPITILYNRLEASEADRENRYPQATGTDIYPFRSAGNAANNSIRTPGAAMKYYSSRMDAFQQLAQHRGQAFEAVFASYAEIHYYTPETLLASYYGHKDEAERQAALERDLRLARAGNRGFSLGEDGKINRWFRYWAPPRYATAMAWVSLARGADSMSVYHWKGKWDLPNAKTPKTIIDMLGWDGQGSRGLSEFAAFAKIIRPFGKLMRSVQREATPFVSPREGDDLVQTENTGPGTLLRGLPRDVTQGVFTVPGYRGKMVVLANTHAGTWSNGKTMDALKESDPFRIDDKGELIDFTPITQIRKLDAQIATNQEAVDLLSGKPIPIGADGKLKLEVEPGGGRILFVAPQGSGEAQKLIDEYQLAAQTG